MLILGISSFYHDSGACLIEDGKIKIAVQEERFTRIKHDNSFPHNAIQECLDYTKIRLLWFSVTHGTFLEFNHRNLEFFFYELYIQAC